MQPEQFGPYLVYEELGVGGMATVHRAVLEGVEGFRKPIALKRLHPYLCSTPEIVQSFVREAQLASHLQHENIAQTYELGKVQGTYFIAMEYIPGPTLTQVMRQCQLAAGAIPLPVTLGVLTQICDALDYAHNRTDDSGKPLGIIHRDVSPSNIVISNTGCVKLLDFGIAKVTGRSNELDTPTGIVIKGKFDYIAPEYLGGQLDLRADLFALGVIAHEMLTGRKLFAGEDDFETSTLVLEMPIQPPSRWNSSVSHELDHIVLTALQRDPDKRWRSASALAAALTGLTRAPGTRATHAQILDWVKWAFSKKRPENSGELDGVLDMLDQPSSVQIELSPEQRRILNEFDEPLKTMIGVGPMSSPTGARSVVLPPSKPPTAPLMAAASGSQPPTRVAPAGSQPPAAKWHEESGVVVAGAPERKKSYLLRYVLYVLLILVAAAGGVAVTAYLLDVQLF